MADKFDLVLKGGRVIDGSGNPWFNKDIGIANGKITALGAIPTGAGKTIDVAGMTVAPGFIDIHNHADMTILQHPGAESYVAQGVTTLVTGNCGIGPTPVKRSDVSGTAARRYLEGSAKRKYRFPELVTMSESYDIVEKLGIGLNLAPLVPHGTVRAVVKGYSATTATGEEMKQMQKIIAGELQDGAFGLSTGLIYPPGCFSDTAELVELAGTLRKHGGVYASHIRNEGDHLIESMKEAVQIGEENGVSVQISHHKAAGAANWGKVNESLELMEKARRRGVEVNCDVYPYTAGSTGIMALLPIWVMDGGNSKALERLSDRTDRERIQREMSGRTGASAGIMAGWDGVFISSCTAHTDYEGKSLTEILKVKAYPDEAYTRFFDLLLDLKGVADIVSFMMNEDDVRTVTRSPLACIASDGWAMSPGGGGKPHPRLYGTFPRVLARYVRDEKLLSLEEAVRKMTSLPAGKLGLKGRGLIKEGFWADLVVFDPERIQDKATYENPHQYPEGISYVLVNGRVVVENGSITSVRAGKVLRKG